MTSNYKQLKIDKQEELDRYVATEALKEMFRDKASDFVAAGIEDHYDLSFTLTNNGKSGRVRVEVKERNKDVVQLLMYPNAELKERKLFSLLNGDNTPVLYVVLLNKETAYIYNLRAIDFSKITKNVLYLKRIQYDPNSATVPTPTYLIPYSEAMNTISIRKYYDAYYKQTKED